MSYDFRHATTADLPLLQAWLKAPHLVEWFDDWCPELDRTDVRCWIVSVDETPIGYIQDYRIGDFPGHHLSALTDNARGIDQFIGPAELLGRGHGPAFIKQHAASLVSMGAPAIGTDPDPKNGRAIRAYEKAGFRQLGPPIDSEWGRVLPMGYRP